MLYLIRHGTTSQPLLRPPGDLTPASRDEWLLDHGLSSRGQDEAGALRERIAHFNPAPERYLASPRRRTQETALLAGLPHARLEIDQRLHEWWEGESMEELHARTQWLLAQAESSIVAAFTHGGFIRAVVAALVVGGDTARFGPTFHDLRRMLHVWNCSVSVVGHGASGLELIALNVCPAVDAMLGRP